MGIQISTAVVMPAITYNKIHMTKLEIVQPTFQDDSIHPIYQVVIHYRHYGVTDGQRYYMNEEVQKVALEDFLQAALENAGQGDMTLLTALQGIEAAVAGIIEAQVGIETTIV